MTNLTLPIPLRPEATEYLDAGNVRFGVEYRFLNDELMAAHHDQSPEQRKQDESIRDESREAEDKIDDRGGSIHVIDPSTSIEYLQFDIFDEGPHYHYITPGKYHVRIEFDDVADPNFKEFVFSRIATRLPEMLSVFQDTPESFVKAIDRNQVAAAVPELRRMYDAACSSGPERTELARPTKR